MCEKDYGEHVFVVGSSRSGTTLVHTILMSCPKYAVYRAETQLLNGCDTKYGDLANRQSRISFLSDWFRSRQFQRSGVTEKEFLEIFNTGVKPSYIWLLSKFMNLVASKQMKDRWIDSTPRNIFALKDISKYFPNAKIVHVIRDGRAVSLSRTKLGWSGVGAKNFDKGLGYSALAWEESVNAAFNSKDTLLDRYLEIKYEELVENPNKTISILSQFLDIPELNYQHINAQDCTENQQCAALASKNNSAFGDLGGGISGAAAYRWKELLTKEQIYKLNAFVGNTLEKYGYPVTKRNNKNIKFIYEMILSRIFFSLKCHMKRMPGMKRFLSTPLELDVD